MCDQETQEYSHYSTTESGPVEMLSLQVFPQPKSPVPQRLLRATAVGAAIAILVMLLPFSSSAEATSGERTLAIARAGALSDIGVGAALVAGGRADALVLAASDSVLGIETAEFMSEIQPREVLLVGGRAVLSNEVEADIARLVDGVQLRRFDGADRIETAADGARLQLEAGAGVTLILANGWSLADVSVAAAAVAAGVGDAVLYSSRDELGSATSMLLSEVRPAHVILVGGTAALTASVETELDSILQNVTVQRLGGATRVETAALVAEAGYADGASSVVVANGWRLTEVGIAAALAAADTSSAVLYTSSDALDDAAENVISGHSLREAVLIGDTDALHERVASAVTALLGSAAVERISGRTDSDTAAKAARRALFGASTAGGPSSGNIFKSVTSGGGHACGLMTTNNVYCWGNNEFGQSVAPDRTFRGVAAGWGHTCALSDDNAGHCWGNNEIGQSTAPSAILRSVSAGVAHSCGLSSDGSARCWGDERLDASAVAQVQFESIVSGGAHSCGIDVKGALQCWGNNSQGQLEVPAGSYQAVSAGGAHSCALGASGEAVCWGNDDASQSSPPSGAFTAISAGWASTCGLRSGGAVVCWGYSDVADNAPTEKFASISVGWSFACGIGLDGHVKCWGDLGVLGYR